MSAEAFEEGTDHSANLIFAMCHEISNLVAAIRLQAHLVDEDLDARGLAVASLEIDDLSARSAAILALIRPVLSPAPAEIAPLDAGVIALGFERAIVDYGGRGFEIAFDIPSDLPEIRAETEVFHYILLSQAYGAMEAMSPGGEIRVEVVVEEKEVIFVIEDGAPEEEEHLAWREASLRGRALECAVAHQILTKRGARFSVERRGAKNRTEIAAPRA
ncbi:MAG: hypothetical protein ACI8W3_001900 [Myxococcota bacterium]|jgi:hypothetical protein